MNVYSQHHITPLHVAAKWGKSNMVTLFLDRSANLESKTRDGLTPLHCAARSGHETVVDLLLERGAPFSSKTKNGLAPLHMSAQGDHVEAARVLLNHKAPVDEVLHFHSVFNSYTAVVSMNWCRYLAVVD